ncbi:alpha/beta fold hydrolase [Microbacterium sp. ISL-108]|nr:alpha/beta fold hydrolase [Microbacterium sp. ISL-108]RKN67244.1 alpha/beta fold hydrolase [Microbacterium sp. CGR2]
MYVEKSGDEQGRRVLLLHGGGVGGWMWEPLREHLDSDIRLLVPDLPGHDRSAGEPYLSHENAVREHPIQDPVVSPAGCVGSGSRSRTVLVVRLHSNVANRIVAVALCAAIPSESEMTCTALASSGVASRLMR